MLAHRVGLCALAASFAGACAGGDDAGTAGADDAGAMADEGTIATAEQSITAGDLLRRITDLSSDDFEGRAPGTPGEEKTVQYLTDAFKQMGLAPGNPDGTYIQDVPLVGFIANVDASVTVGGNTMHLEGPDEFLADTRQAVPEVKVTDSDIVFVGYGVVAPEYGWDDYKGVDVTGKTIIMLVNDPPVTMADDPSQLDTAMFRGPAMTYYGRWTYKYEIAAEKGAAAALVVHETGPAGYPYEVLSAGWGREAFDIVTPDSGRSRVPVQGWLPVDEARKILSAAGQDFDALKTAAATKDFTPVDLGATASFTIENQLRQVASRNVVAKLEGSDPEHADEYVIYSAHWDHLGRDTTIEGDQIFNGAHDNASGTAALLELAEAFKKLPQPPERSVLFLAVTAEEKGLLGAKYYAQNPLYPLDHTLADINMDGINQWGPTSDFTVIGLGNSTLDDVLADAARTQNRTLRADAEPEKGFYYRSDHFEFAKEGVPALYTDAGIDFIGKSADWGRQKRDEYTTNDYHKPSDEVKPDWDLTGGAHDVGLLFRVGVAVANGDQWPEWKEGTEFKAKREQMMASK